MYLGKSIKIIDNTKKIQYNVKGKSAKNRVCPKCIFVNKNL